MVLLLGLLIIAQEWRIMVKFMHDTSSIMLPIRFFDGKAVPPTQNLRGLLGMWQNPFVTPYCGKTPVINADAYVDVSARLIGDVVIHEGASIWPMAVLRADNAEILVGRRAAVLDLAMLEAPEGYPVMVGAEAIISHGAMIHGAIIQPNVLVGVGAIILDGAIISKGSIIGAGSLILSGKHIPPNSLVVGVPGRVIRETTEEERKKTQEQMEELYRKSRIYIASETIDG